jgi:hypothetical protein
VIAKSCTAQFDNGNEAKMERPSQISDRWIFGTQLSTAVYGWNPNVVRIELLPVICPKDEESPEQLQMICKLKQYYVQTRKFLPRKGGCVVPIP